MATGWQEYLSGNTANKVYGQYLGITENSVFSNVVVFVRLGGNCFLCFQSEKDSFSFRHGLAPGRGGGDQL